MPPRWLRRSGPQALLLLLVLLVLLAPPTIVAAADGDGDAAPASDERGTTSPSDGAEAAPKAFWPLKPQEGVGIALAALGLLIAGGSGIGAGGLVLPLFIILFDMPPKRAAALTSCTVMVRLYAC